MTSSWGLILLAILPIILASSFATEPSFTGGCSAPIRSDCNCHCSLQPSDAETKEKQQITEEDAFDFLFSKRAPSDYIIVHDLRHDLSSLTLSLWMATSDRTSTTPHGATLFSYATSTGDNTLLVIDLKKVSLFVLGQEKQSTVILNDGKWHSLIFTWENSAGSWKFFLDGALVQSGSGMKKGGVIPKAGTIVLGQDQDKVGGGFQESQGYIGLLSRVNLWDRVLTQQEISALSKDCSPGIHGNILNWDRSWISGIRGGVQVMRPSFCRP